MFHMTALNDDRLRELRETADELRLARTAGSDGHLGFGQVLRLRLGTTLLAAGTMLVSGTRPATASRAGR